MPPFASSPISQVPCPALYLYPLNDSFIPKHISLVNGQRVKIGRQTNAKTVPAERNGYFDSKVLSRQHAEVWEENGKIYIKDVKSSNGTFINSERLSAEGLESDPWELKNEDIVEFGIDIVGEDNRTIVHHKVAARVLCIFNEQDAQAAARMEAQHQQNPPMYSLAGQGQGVGRNANAFNFAGANQAAGSNGVPGLQRGQATRGVDLGGMGGNARQPMKGGITFQDLLSRLQGELQKSRETGNELTNLNGTMSDIHETLGGNLPLNPPYAQQLPPVVPPQAHLEGHQMPLTVPSSTSQEPASALSELQSQLRQTQESLASHVEKIRTLEGMLAEHEAIKREVSSMRDMMEDRKREMELLRIHSQSPNHLRRSHSHVEDHGDSDYISDDDDARSVGTITAHELERVEEEDEEQIAAEEEEEERRRRRDELRPRTPEPTGMGMTEDDEDHDEELQRDNTHLHPSSMPPAPSTSSSAPLPDELIQRMTTLASQLESALELSRSLEAQHATAQSTISSLESKVTELESMVKVTQGQVQAQAESHQHLAETIEAKLMDHGPPSDVDTERTQERESLKEMFTEWKKGMEGQWGTVQEEWTDERDRMRRAKEEVEVRLRAIEDGVGTSVSKMETGLASLVALQAQLQRAQPNGSAKTRSSGGLVTPPSPRSLSAASTRSRQRKRRSSSNSGQSRSRSASPSRDLDAADEDLSMSSPSRDDLSPSAPRVRHRLPWMAEDSASESEEPLANGEKMPMDNRLQKTLSSMQYPITPEPSLRDQPVTGLANPSTVASKPEEKAAPRDTPHLHNMSTVAGVLILSVAAAAVIWRVKPETAV
ncbi:hypothetical protein EIP91_004658 [Steccherinum ochraceum]|uniref:FHA domain-containing protein n=1 Tax=Steccherinum ochraceum TaxID=92696 RepID=A0A4R0RNU2_9APHY|nr:hypothetical protein EIP91_004658 [Steccherinum ochraceum]